MRPATQINSATTVNAVQAPAQRRHHRRMVWGDVRQSAPRQNSWLGNLRVLACFHGFRLGSRVAPVGLKGMVTANCRNLEERLYGALERT